MVQRTMGLRLLKKEATRERVLGAALALFARKGYDETSIEDIAEEAQVARGTVFNYFKRKEDMLFAWVETRRAAARAILEGPPAGRNAREQIRSALLAMCRTHEAEKQKSQALIRCWLRCGGPLLEGASDTARPFEAVLEAGITSGELRPDTDPARAARAVLDLYLGCLYRWAAEKHARLGVEVDHATAPYLAGLTRLQTGRRS